MNMKKRRPTALDTTLRSSTFRNWEFKGLARYNSGMRSFRWQRPLGGGGAILALLAGFSSLAGLAAAQQRPPDSPLSPPIQVASVSTPSSPPVAGETPKPVAPPHAFWDRANILLFSEVAVFRGLDYASTRNMQARGREEILLPDDVVNNSAGFASLDAASAATSIGLSYWMHRSGHHRIERWISIAHVSVTGFGAVRNYALKSKPHLLTAGAP